MGILGCKRLFVLLELRRRLDVMNIKMEDIDDIEMDDFSKEVIVKLKGAIEQSTIKLNIK